jgi:hypothetical protein
MTTRVPKTETVYRAKFSRLKLEAFGIQQTVDYVCEVVIYQARHHPELWAARPMFEHGAHTWAASSSAELREIIAADFELCLEQWSQWDPVPAHQRRPTLQNPSPAQWRKVG